METSDGPLIICFGDSLTVGYQSPTPAVPVLIETPYGAFLQKRLKGKAHVIISGVCGEVTREMTQRFQRDVLAHNPASVVILGGTNDLGLNTEPAEIMKHLETMSEQALAAGIQPILVTVPSLRLEMGTDESRHFLNDHITRRRVLNAFITDYGARKKVPCVDLFTATAEKTTWRLATPYSNDGLHLTTDGYAKLADLLYEQVFGPRFGSA